MVFTVTKAGVGLEYAFGRRHDAGVAWIERDGHAQGAAERLEYGFTLMMRIFAAQIVDMQGDQGVIDEALEEFACQVHVEAPDMRTREWNVVLQAGAARKVDHHARQRLVERYVRVAVAHQPGLVPHRSGK